jgi:NAD(P)-dependent dehydrogenase (short-subunit alcohol dehydrogenase family)
VPLALDVTEPESIEGAVKAVLDRAGRIDMLVNNAGVSLTAPLVEAPMDRIRNLIDTNLTGVIAMIQAVFPHMAERGGQIVNLGSVIGLLPTPFTAAYCASKAGIHMLSEVLRLELAPFGILVTEVQPAQVTTEIEDRAASGLEEYRQSRYAPYFEAVRRRVTQAKTSPMSAEDYAAFVADGILAKHPPRIIRGGGRSAVLQTAARMPGPIRDILLRREFGLPPRRP